MAADSRLPARERPITNSPCRKHNGDPLDPLTGAPHIVPQTHGPTRDRQSGGALLTTHVHTVIVGGGQAGLAISRCLTLGGLDHLVLEQAYAPAEAWRNHRWDSFTLNTPNWQSQLPGAPHLGDPDGFMSRREIVAYLEGYAARLPLRCGSRVKSVERDGRWGSYLVATEDGETFVARNVVIATGLYQRPKVPAFAAGLPSQVLQIHSDAYRSPAALPSGAVLVVGSAQSGA